MPRSANSGAAALVQHRQLPLHPLVGDDIAVQVEPHAQRLGQRVGGVERARVIAPGYQQHLRARGGPNAHGGLS